MCQQSIYSRDNGAELEKVNIKPPSVIELGFPLSLEDTGSNHAPYKTSDTKYPIFNNAEWNSGGTYNNESAVFKNITSGYDQEYWTISTHAYQSNRTVYYIKPSFNNKKGYAITSGPHNSKGVIAIIRFGKK